MRTKTSESTYRRFVEFEEKAAAFYFQLAAHFSERPELSAFWLEMGMQEKQHAGLLQFCIRDGLFVPELPEPSEVQRFARLFNRLQKRAADPELTTRDAFLLAFKLEASEINAVYSLLTTPLHKSPYLLRRKIALSVPDHIDELISAAAKFGIRNLPIEELNSVRKEFG